MLRISFPRFASLQPLALALTAWLAPSLALADDAPATVGAAITGAHNQFVYILPLVTAVCYVGAVNYTVQVLLRAYAYSQQTEKGIWGTGLIQRAFGAAALFAIPKILYTLQTSLFGDATGGFTTNWQAGETTGEGLDVALVHMVKDVVPALGVIVGLIAFTSGLFMIVGAVVAMSNQGHMDDKVSKKMILVRFAVGTMLTSFATSVGTLLVTIFGSSTSNAVATLAYDKAGLTQAEGGQVDVVFNAIFAWLAMIGLIAILRGLWVLKDSVEGNKGLTAPLTHLIAGAALVNIVPTIHMIQSTLGCDAAAACGILS